MAFVPVESFRAVLEADEETRLLGGECSRSEEKERNLARKAV